MGKINRGPCDKSDQHLQLVHFETLGNCLYAGISGSYFSALPTTSLVSAKFFYSKSLIEVSGHFSIHRDSVDLLTGHKVKALRSDGGIKYKLINFGGITRQVSAPYTQHQNDVSERLNRTLVTMARYMLSHANLSVRFWDSTISTA